MDKHELLAKAKRDYPVGSTIISPISGNKYRVGSNPHWSGNYIDNSQNGYLYQNGKWAKIISYPIGWKKQIKYYFY